ncbi:hypothetical protein PMZ80_010020 [Knufia obscura]|uniref:DUF7918 domain-containing protein n=1 Tax=Knufia obscura TaxID=1635080 RepID=A0ABR0RB91_9EURO|nr:hypothetical protein PMZ80_010020 [Knufia obscura]
MAITEAFEVTIVAGGSPLPEYDVPPDEARHYKALAQTPTNTVHRLVAVEKNQLFAINSRVRSGYQYTTPTIQHCVSFNSTPMYIFSATPTDRGRVVDGVLAKDNQRVVRRPFKFCPLELNDDTIEAEDIEGIATNIGSITVQFWQASTFVDVPDTLPDAARETGTSIREQAVKGRPIDLRVGFGDSIPVDQWPYQANTHSMNQQPLATFVFICRTKRALKLMDIAHTKPESIDGHVQQPDAKNNVLSRRSADNIEKRPGNAVKRPRPEGNQHHEDTPKRLKQEASPDGNAEIPIDDTKHEQEGVSGDTATAQTLIRDGAARGPTNALLGNASGDPVSATSSGQASKDISTAAKQEAEL